MTPSIADRMVRLAAVTALALAAGCHYPPPAEGPAPAVSTPQVAEANSPIVMLDPQLAGRLSIDRQGVQRDPNGRLALQVFVRNRTSFVQNVDVQTAFRDAQGFDINDETAWQRLILEPNQTEEYHAVSLDARAAGYVVRFREGM